MGRCSGRSSRGDADKDWLRVCKLNPDSLFVLGEQLESSRVEYVQDSMRKTRRTNHSRDRTLVNGHSSHVP